MTSLPFDATDLCYLLSLEERSWVTQEVVHPLWVPMLWVYRAILRTFGWHGFVLVPNSRFANVLVAVATLLLSFQVARRLTKDTLASTSAVLLLAATPGFDSAAMRPTPYAPAFLCLTGSLMLLISDHQPSLRRHVVAGALAGVSMALHMSAMALAPAALLCVALDPERRSWPAAAARVAAYGAAMVTVAAACWLAWLRFNGLPLSFLAPANLRTLFGGVEQVPGTSIYSSGSWWSQLTGITRTMGMQGRLLAAAGLASVIAEIVRTRIGAAPTRPVERRLLVAAVAIFGAVAGFFFINNTHNGFIFASLSLFPIVVARSVSRWGGARWVLGATPLLAVPLAAQAALAGMNRFKDPLLAEVRFVESTLGPRAVLLVPGCAFAEVRLLSGLNAFEVQLQGMSPGDCVLPRAQVGEVLRARVRSWQDHGVRVVLAYGDEVHDFNDDANGQEKAVQLFWRPELAAKDRAPRLQAVRSALVSAGLRLGEPIVSPRGARYAEVTAEGRADGPPSDVSTCGAERPQSYDARAGIEQAVVDRFHAVVADDPWAPCDTFCLGLTRPPYTLSTPYDDQLRALRAACACPEDAGPSRRDEQAPTRSCHWTPDFDRAAARAYIVPWAQRVGLGVPLDWGVRFDGDRVRIELKLQGGTLRLTWRLLDSCEASPVEVSSDGLAASALPAADAVQEFARHLPAPHTGGG